MKKLNPFQHFPVGVGALFFIQIFSTLSFAVLLSTLVLYTTQQLNFSAKQANVLMGSFAAFNYGLHLLGGYLGGRFFSYRNLFTLGMVLQIVGCWILAALSIDSLYIGLGFFLAGSGLNVTCVNMMLTQLFKAQDKNRESAFLWNYSGMNIGFFIGFTIAGFFQLHQNYQLLFIVASFANFLAIILIGLQWKKLADKNTALSMSSQSAKLLHYLFGFGIISILIPLVMLFLDNASITNWIILTLGIGVYFYIIVISLRQSDIKVRHQLTAFVIFATTSLVFWSLYQIAPMGLMLFAKYNVDRVIFGFTIPPQWIQNINTIVIIIGGPLLSQYLIKKRQRGKQILLPFQIASALLLIGAGFLLLPIGIYFAAKNGLVNFSWLFYSYILQSIGELMISPIGYAMIGFLVPPQLQGLMMGTWMMMIGLAAIFASFFSQLAVRGATTLNPLMTNEGYFQTFFILGIVACFIGILLLTFNKKLLFLTKEHAV